MAVPGRRSGPMPPADHGAGTTQCLAEGPRYRHLTGTALCNERAVLEGRLANVPAVPADALDSVGARAARRCTSHRRGWTNWDGQIWPLLASSRNNCSRRQARRPRREVLTGPPAPVA